MIVGLAGYARAGKDTVGSILVEDYGFKRVALADKMKEALAILNPIVSYINDTRISDFPSDREGVPDWERAKENPEVRRLLQRFGTEVGRNLFGPDFWIQQAIKGLDFRQPVNYVFTDIRFPNEADKVRILGGKTFWIKRPGIKPANSHISELALLPEMLDGVIYNNCHGDYRSYLKDQIERKILE